MRALLKVTGSTSVRINSGGKRIRVVAVHCDLFGPVDNDFVCIDYQDANANLFARACSEAIGATCAEVHGSIGVTAVPTKIPIQTVVATGIVVFAEQENAIIALPEILIEQDLTIVLTSSLGTTSQNWSAYYELL